MVILALPKPIITRALDVQVREKIKFLVLHDIKKKSK